MRGQIFLKRGEKEKAESDFGTVLQMDTTATDGSCRQYALHFLERVEYLADKGEPCGEFVTQPELVAEKWGNTYIGECLKEYSVTTRFQIEGWDDCLELEVIWDASREEFLNLWESLDKVTRKIDFGRYCRHIDWKELA